jgi:hypothetical protein
MPLPLPDLEARVRTLLQTGHTLAVRWDCGNDESLLFVDLDGAELPFNYRDPHDLADNLCDYLLGLLELPGVGSFELRGGGPIVLENNQLILTYQSEFVDFEGEWLDALTDEQRAALVVHPATGQEPPGMIDPDLSEDYSGQQVLFEPEE